VKGKEAWLPHGNDTPDINISTLLPTQLKGKMCDEKLRLLMPLPVILALKRRGFGRARKA
jgi:hypothetical protein